MKIVMDMGSYEIERDQAEGTSSAGAVRPAWGQAVEIQCQQQLVAPDRRGAYMPVELAEADVEAFLQEMSTCGRGFRVGAAG